MTAIFRLLDVDYGQWRAVTRTLLRTDFRLPLSDEGPAPGRVSALLTMAVFLSLFGLGAAVIAYIGRDPLLTGTFALVYLSVMLTTSLLTQHGMTLLSRTDLVILGPRPVSSRTFLAIRVTNVVFHAFVITTLMAHPVVAAYTLAGGVAVARGVAALAAIYAWSLAVTLALVVTYGTLLRTVGGARLTRALGYLQLATGFLAYGGLLLTSQSVGDRMLATASMPDAWWLVLIPPAWFASYIELAAGVGNSTTALRALMSVLAVIALGAALRGKLGAEYARRLADLPNGGAAAPMVTRRTRLFASGEARAAAILVRAHFRHDLRVRLGILGIVPLIVLTLLMGTPEGPFDLLAFSVLLFPGVLTRYFASSEAHRAAWIYRSTPADHPRLVVATTNVAVVYFLLPFLLLVSAAFAWRFGDVVQAAVHTAMLGMLSYIALQGAAVISPRLPFALPPDKTRGEASLMGWMLVVIVGGQAALYALDRWVYVSTPRVAATGAMLVAIAVLLRRLLGWRARSSSR